MSIDPYKLAFRLLALAFAFMMLATAFFIIGAWFGRDAYTGQTEFWLYAGIVLLLIAAISLLNCIEIMVAIAVRFVATNTSMLYRGIVIGTFMAYIWLLATLFGEKFLYRKPTRNSGVADRIGVALAWVVTFGANVNTPPEASKTATVKSHHVPRRIKSLHKMH